MAIQRHGRGSSALIMACLLTAPAAGEAGSPVGRWRTVDDRSGRPRAIVNIALRGGELHGAIEHLFPEPGQPPDPRCLRCPGDRRDQPVVGMVVLWGHRLEGGRWRGGRLFDPESGKEYRGQLWLEGADRLKVRGYWGPFYRTQTWYRVPDPAADRAGGSSFASGSLPGRSPER